MNKLVRDRIPEIMIAQGKKPEISTVSGKEYLFRLFEKLREESEELIKDQTAEEVADVIEVLKAICEYKDFDWDQIEKIRVQKALEKGAFKKKFVITAVS